MAKPYKEGTTWSIRVRVGGRDNYRAGFPSSKEAAAYAAALAKSIRDEGAPQGKGPTKTTLAEALGRKALEKLPTMKGAEQEGNRVNRYLRLAGLPILKVTPTGNDSGKLFDVVQERPSDERSVPNGLKKHRDALVTKSATSERLRKSLALTMMSEVRRFDLQTFINRLREEGDKPATLDQERALLRGLFNYARSKWNWTEPGANPATGLDLPAIDNARDTVLSMEQQPHLDQALDSGYNRKVKPAVILLRETAMRTGELMRARWKHVVWERKVLQVPVAKACKRDVPLSPEAMAVLHELKGPGEPAPDAFIVDMSGQAFKAAWQRARARADLEGLNIHDLRHTAATRLMLETGNVGLVKVLTGHKTDSQLARYINIKADDVVRVLHAEGRQAPTGIAPQEAGSQPPQTPVAATAKPRGARLASQKASAPPGRGETNANLGEAAHAVAPLTLVVKASGVQLPVTMPTNIVRVDFRKGRAV